MNTRNRLVERGARLGATNSLRTAHLLGCDSDLPLCRRAFPPDNRTEIAATWRTEGNYNLDDDPPMCLRCMRYGLAIGIAALQAAGAGHITHQIVAILGATYCQGEVQ